jgi:hypothetical protein
MKQKPSELIGSSSVTKNFRIKKQLNLEISKKQKKFTSNSAILYNQQKGNNSEQI